MRERSRFMIWFSEHIAIFRTRPSNGRKSIKEIDFMLLELNENQKRVKDSASAITKDARQAKKLVAEGNDALKLHNS